MKRLSEETQLSRDDQRLADLLRAAAPFASDPFRKRRVWVALERGAHSRPRRSWLRPVVIAVLLVTGSAAAALGHRYAAGVGRFGATSPAAAPSAHPVPPAPVASPPLAAPVVEVSPPPVEQPAAPPVVAPAKSTARARPESGEDATRVVQALQALRTHRDPARAQALLDDYLETQPRGSLAGEALALSIEAASARNDPRAADYARRYLASYPNGKYRELAKRALQK